MPRYRIIARRLSFAVCSAALAGVLLCPLSNVAMAFGASLARAPGSGGPRCIPYRAGEPRPPC